MATNSDMTSLGDALNAALGGGEAPLASATPLSQNPVIEATPAPETNTAVTAPVETAPAITPEVNTTESILGKTLEIKTPSKLIDSMLTPESEKVKEVPKVTGELSEDEKLPGKATNSANSAFAAKSRALRTAEQELTALKQELEKARQSGSTEASSEVQSIKTELEENRKLVSDYENQLSVVRLEATREFDLVSILGKNLQTGPMYSRKLHQPPYQISNESLAQQRFPPVPSFLIQNGTP